MLEDNRYVCRSQYALQRIVTLPLVRVAGRLPLLGWRLQQWMLRPFSHPMPPIVLEGALRQRLTEFLRPDIDRFRSLTGRPLAHWSV